MNATSAANGSGHHDAEYKLALYQSSVTINLVLSLPLNVYVVRLIVSGARGTLSSDIFSLSLALSQIFYCIFSVFVFLYVHLRVFFSLRIFRLSLGFLFTASPLFQCCICFDCYLGVVHPVLFLRCKPLRYRVACCCVVWLMTLVSSIYASALLGYVYLLWFFAHNVLCVSAVVFCCLSVLRALKRPTPGRKEEGGTGSNRMKRHAFQSIWLIMICMATGILLNLACVPLQFVMSTANFTNVINISLSVALMCGFTQPLLYLHRTGRLSCLRKPYSR